MVVLKSREEIELMQASGQVLSSVLAEMERIIRPGMTTAELNRVAEQMIRDAGGIPSFLNYGSPPFPGSICASIDQEVVHGIPSEGRVIQDGSIVSIDAGVILDGWHSDAARTFIVGAVPDEVRTLVKDTETSFWKAAAKAVIGNRLGDVSAAVQQYAEDLGYGVVKVLTGHGIGRNLHEEPDVPNFGRPGRGMRLMEGMVLAIEPMINLGTERVVMSDDQWTVETADGRPSAHYENTVAITKDGPMILTVPAARARQIPDS